jgi:hypothetical protein
MMKIRGIEMQNYQTCMKLLELYERYLDNSEDYELRDEDGEKCRIYKCDDRGVIVFTESVNAGVFLEELKSPVAFLKSLTIVKIVPVVFNGKVLKKATNEGEKP